MARCEAQQKVREPVWDVLQVRNERAHGQFRVVGEPEVEIVSQRNFEAMSDQKQKPDWP